MSNELQLTPQPQLSTLSLIGRIVESGITTENVTVIERMIALRREETVAENKSAFNRALFALKREIAAMEFYADKQGTNKAGAVIYTYCSESEISAKLEPVLFKHGFTMMFSQSREQGSVTIEINLIHESGHEVKSNYSVRVGQSNQLKDDTAVDSGSTTSAWRHLVIKMFGLKSRIREEGDARNIGAFISQEKAFELAERVIACGADAVKFLAFAQAESFEKIGESMIPQLESLLRKKEQAAKPKPVSDLADENLFT
jgi:hypothetical protein